MIRSGTLSEVDYQLGQEWSLGLEAGPSKWLGKAAATFKNKSVRDAAFAALPRYVSVRSKPSHRPDPLEASLSIKRHSFHGMTHFQFWRCEKPFLYFTFVHVRRLLEFSSGGR